MLMTFKRYFMSFFETWTFNRLLGYECLLVPGIVRCN